MDEEAAGDVDGQEAKQSWWERDEDGYAWVPCTADTQRTRTTALEPCSQQLCKFLGFVPADVCLLVEICTVGRSTASFLSFARALASTTNRQVGEAHDTFSFNPPLPSHLLQRSYPEARRTQLHLFAWLSPISQASHFSHPPPPL